MDVEKRGPLYTVGGIVNWYSHYGKSLENKKVICTPMLTAALFIIAYTWKQPKCPSMNGWIKKMWYIFIMEYCSAIKRNKSVSFAETVIQSKVSQKEKNR